MSSRDDDDDNGDDDDDDDDDEDDDDDDDYNRHHDCFHLDMTMMIPPTPGKRHQDSIANRYRPATKSETLSYLNAWTQKQSVPPHTITRSDICPTPRPPPCPQRIVPPARKCRDAKQYSAWNLVDSLNGSH